ncbi:MULTISPECIES: hypothetical protein [Rhizobium]|uniref:hypothetical protein n=1 Tax=Rhizobium TaxID=379 RepID=UPI001B326DE7|nr:MULTISPECIES: hypothetical protein [Rhizobium]MBX4910325.1 hypothetical protein [Rhizobium bangladeshense]MBX5231850.1 hypothetical protein [Rhizobium sp. NLR4a]MBX5259456.1 hypothetical protein [Rhizobium sp. NLR16b]MBX5265548.1 hypothetical protein [Rhizobium sp. NLR16a]MBX5269981.1 hypothetical protein [Rhizobium sp. NLR17b]
MSEVKAAIWKVEAERLRKILKSPESKQLPKLAEYLAFETDESAKACIKVLKAAITDFQAAVAKR